MISVANTESPEAATKSGGDEAAEPLVLAGAEVGDFRLVRELGHGGMGTVFLARDSKLGRRVALKFPSKNVIGNRQAVERFMSEARVTASFSHPNIVGLYSVNEHEGQPYVALEYVEGETLRERMLSDPPSGRAALRMAYAMMGAIAEAHRHGVLHRDLKPENVLLGKDGRLRIADFGLALHVERSELASVIEGTALYMAPEQWMGRPEQASDIWAFALIVHELLTGILPFEELSPAQRISVLCDENPTPIHRAGMSESVVNLLAECLEKIPSKRPSADAIVQRLEQLVADVVPLADLESDGPFRGLSAFDERHASLFFGREQEVLAAVERFRDDPLLPIVAPSGTGKSSFVRAGLLPRLREQERWTLITARPGADPFGSLSASLHAATADRPLTLRAGQSSEPHADRVESVRELADKMLADPAHLSVAVSDFARASNCKVLLFLDALEELYTHNPSQDVRARYLEAIGVIADSASCNVRAVVAFRDDYLGRIAQATAKPLFERIFVLRELSSDALHSALTRPLAVYGYRFDDPTLPAQMIAEIQDEIAALPLLQFAISQLWSRRDREKKVLTREAFEQQGGVTGALVKHADGVLATMLDDQVALARVLLLRMVTHERTRKAVAVDGLLSGLPERAVSVIERLSQARLIATRRGAGEGNVVELVHEALIRRWTQLSRWIDESREELVELADVTPAAERWARQGRVASDVWTGPALQQARRVLLRPGVDLTETVRAFLDVGHAREQQATTRRRLALGTVIGGLALAVAGATVGLVIIAKEKRQAQSAQSFAEQSGADALLEAAEAALRAHEGGKASALIRTSLERVDSVRGRALLNRAIRERVRWIARRGGAPTLRSVVDHPYVVINGDQGTINVLDERSGLGNWQFGESGAPFAFAMREQDVLWTASEQCIYRWNLRENSGEKWLAFEPNTLREGGVFTPDAATLVLRGRDGIVLVDVRSKRMVRHPTPAPIANEPSIDRSGRYVAVALEDHTLRVYAVDGWREVRRVALSGIALNRAVFSPDGASIAFADGSALLMVSLGDQRTERLVISAANIDAIYSHRALNRILLWRRDEATIEVWRFGDARPERTLPLSDGEFLRGISHDGLGYWTTNGFTGESRLVRIDAPAEPAIEWSGDGVRSVAVVDNGQSIAFGAGSRLWHIRLDDPRRMHLIETATAPILSLASHGDWEAYGQTDGVVILRNQNTGARFRIETEQSWPFGLRFSTAGDRLAVGGRSPRVSIWNVNSHSLAAQLELNRDKLFDLAWSTDDQQLLTGMSSTGSMQVFSLLTQQPLHELTLGNRAVGANWDRDARRVAIGARVDLVLHDLVDQSKRHVPLAERPYLTLFSADSQRVYVSGADGMLLHLAWNNPDNRTSYVGHRAGMDVNRMTLTASDRTLVSSSDDGTVRAWDVETAMPRWRAPIVLTQPQMVFTHRGWETYNDQPATPTVSLAFSTMIQRHARDAIESRDGHYCVRLQNNSVEYWGPNDPAPTFVGLASGGPDRVLVGDGRCARIDQQRLNIHEGATDRMIGESVIAAAYADEEHAWLVATSEQIQWYSPTGVLLRHIRAPQRVALMLQSESHLYAASVTGEVFVMSLRAGQGSTAHRVFRRVETKSLPTHRPTVLLGGPVGTLCAGFEDGTVALFDTSSGRLLWSRRMFGSIQHVRWAGSTLHSWTDLGIHAQDSFDLLTASRAEVLRHSREDSPGIWQAGEIALSPETSGL